MNRRHADDAYDQGIGRVPDKRLVDVAGDDVPPLAGPLVPVQQGLADLLSDLVGGADEDRRLPQREVVVDLAGGAGDRVIAHLPDQTQNRQFHHRLGRRLPLRDGRGSIGRQSLAFRWLSLGFGHRVP